MEITSEQNERALNALQKGYNKSWDLFLYGDKEKGIKPGRIETYGTIVGQREVAKNRLKLREQLKGEQKGR